MTNSPLNFQNTIAISDGLSDFHKMVIAFMNKSVNKYSPIQIRYKVQRYFDLTRFKNNLNEKISAGISNYESF